MKSHDIPVIFLSSHAGKEVTDKIEKITCYGFVTRNSDSAALAASIRLALKLHCRNRKLRNTIDNLTLVFRESPDAMTISRIDDSMMLEINDAFTRIMGFPRDKAVGRCAVRDLGLWANPDDRTRLRAELEKHGRADAWEVSFRRMDGSIREHQISARLISYNNEQCMVITSRDITRRRRDEERLGETLRQMHDIIEFLPDPTFIINHEKKVTCWNRAMEQLTGVKKEEMLGHGNYAYARPFYRERRPMLIDLVGMPPAELEAAYDYVKHEGNRVSGGASIPCLDQNAEKYLWGSAAPLLDSAGRHVGAIEIIRDVTEFNLLGKQLLAGEARYRRLHESIRDAFISISMNGLILDVNNVFCGMVGYTEEELRSMTYESLTPERWHSFERDIIRPQIVASGSSDIYEKEFNRKDGTVFPVELHAFLIRDDAGKPDLMWAIVRDITEQRRAKEQLEQMVNEKEVLMRELQHRVKNNLGIIASLLSLEMGNLSDKHSVKIFSDAISRIHSMSYIYDQLSRTSDARHVNLDEYIRKMTTSLLDSYTLGPDHIRLTMKLDAIKLDVKRAVPIGLILNELITNALKYAYPEGAKGVLTVELSRDGESIALIVSDNGIGLPDTIRDRSARGMGLQLIEMLAKQIRGEFVLESRMGTTAQLTFKSG